MTNTFLEGHFYIYHLIYSNNLGSKSSSKWHSHFSNGEPVAQKVGYISK